jgi:CDP-diacylglycerol--serine O-phosphatidyltransferase
MARLSFKERFFDARPPSRRPRRAAYALPTLFTAGNIFLGFIAILRSLEGALLGASGQLGNNPHFEVAAKAIGAAVVLDGLDGRIARMTNTVSAFGREMDSLADVITFGIAPAVLAFTWGVEFVTPGGFLMDHRAGYFLAFIFLLCGAARLARFNVQVNPVPSNPGRPDRKYFVGLPIPAAAAIVAAVVYATDSVPLGWWVHSALWLGLLALLSFLMVSTWRYPSFKEIHLKGPRSPLIVIVFGALIFLIWNYSQRMLLALASVYVATGIVIRAAGIIRRTFRPHNPPPPQPAPPQPEHQPS